MQWETGNVTNGNGANNEEQVEASCLSLFQLTCVPPQGYHFLKSVLGWSSPDISIHNSS